MVDTERFQLGPELIETVTVVAATLADREPREVNPLQVTAYVPLDVDSVGRILESVEKDYEVERVEHGGVCYFRFDNPGEMAPSELDIDAGEHIDDEALDDNLAALNSDEGWNRKTREQHELLRIAADSADRTIELSYFLSRTDIPSARVQSILNDFGAESYVEHSFDDDEDVLEYTFPDLDYPEDRYERHLRSLHRLEGSGSTNPIWILLGVFALLLLVTVIVIRFVA